MAHGERNSQRFVGLYRNALLYAFMFYFFVDPNTLLPSTRTVGRTAAVLSDAPNVYNQSFLLIALVSGYALTQAYRVPWRRIGTAIIPIAPLLLIAILSIAWSNFPDLTIRRASRETIEILSLIFLSQCFSRKEDVLRILFRGFLVILCMDLASAAISPGSFTALGFTGVHTNKNFAGEFLFVAIPLFAIGSVKASINRYRLVALFALAASFGMLAVTQSKTAVGALLFATLLLFVTRSAIVSHRYRGVFVLGALLLIMMEGIAFTNFSLQDWISLAVSDPTLTGRDRIWDYVLLKFSGSPIIGVGYGALWQVGPSTAADFKQMGLYLIFNEAHNGYLEIATQLGLLGIAALLFFLTATFANISRFVVRFERSDIAGLGAYGLYLFWGLVLYNITESLYFQSGIGPWGMLVFVASAVAGRKILLSKIVPKYRRQRALPVGGAV